MNKKIQKPLDTYIELFLLYQAVADLGCFGEKKYAKNRTNPKSYNPVNSKVKKR